MPYPHYQPGSTVAGRYTITGNLGSGGTAGVYRARDTVMNRTVAIKIIADESGSASRNFMTEARAAALLAHPNIVNVYDILSLEGEKCIIMEYICGITLREYLNHRGRLSVKESVNCAHQILRALHAAHSRGIVHRDIKPGNILITTEGRIKVTDFGIARLPDADSFLMPDRTVGTVHYISPEQATGGAIDERSDLYSLGILLYEMLTGHRPFEADTPADVAMMQITARPLPPTERNPGIPEALERIVLCAMEKDPAARFDSAAEMLRILEKLPPELLSGHTRPLREEGSAYRVAVERLDERTMPLPRMKLRRQGEKKGAEEAQKETVKKTLQGEEAVTREEACKAPAAVTREAVTPPASAAREPVAAKPQSGTIGNMRDAFTAQDTVDIMLSSHSASVKATPAPLEDEEPIVFSRRRDLDAAEEIPDGDTDTSLTPIAPVAREDNREEAKRTAQAPSGMLFAGESRIFTVFMLLAALALATVLLIGIIKGVDREPPTAEAGDTYISASRQEVPHAF